MDYDSIIEIIEEQKKDEKLSTKLYRYTGLVQAIEFFSQKLNLDQIFDAAFDFINELLTLEKSAAFILQGSNCVLKKIKGFDSGISEDKIGKNLQNFAMMHGTVLYNRASLEKYFDVGILDDYNITAVIPLIIENSLYGFILISKKTAGEMNQDDFIISEALMRLINNALCNYKRYENLQRSNRELDEKIFNLFAINQSSKVLLSELNLDVLYRLSVDVFSELTQSSVTGFVLYDEKKDKFILKAYKDRYFNEPEADICLTQEIMARIDINKVIIDTSNEKDVLYFNSIFKGGMDVVAPLKPLYIVLLIKNGKIPGFVTLGRTITGNFYKASVFELIESLASATYIALSNAQLFRQVNDQKKVIQAKLKKLISLNNLITNINSAMKIDSMLDLTMKTLEVSFDIEMGLIALYNSEKNCFDVSNALNVDIDKTIIEPNANWDKLFNGKIIFESSGKGVTKYFGKSIYRKTALENGMLIVPIYVERVGIELLGIIIIFKYGRIQLDDEESRLTVETIAGHIAPVMNNLLTLEEQKRFSLPNYIELFKRDLKNEISQALEFSISLDVVCVENNLDFNFKGNAVLENLRTSYNNVYPFTNNNIFIILNGNETKNEDKLVTLLGMENVRIKRYTLGTDFNHYQEFFKLF